MTAQTTLACPKCGGSMLAYERTGIVVEQCQECRGIFLDHGELERLIEAEGGGWSGMVAPPSVEPPEPTAATRGLTRGRRDARRREKTLRDLFGD